MRLWVLTLSLAMAIGAHGQQVTVPPEATAETIKLFADDFFGEEFESYAIPGVSIVFVKGDEVIYQAGYGYADLKAEEPVIPEETVFRAGSVSKSFTAAAVVLLAERGEVVLDAPIDEYITSIDVPRPHGLIRVRNLLTHTAGFDDTIVGMHERDKGEWLPLAKYLEAELPAPALPPGLGISYSSWDFALAGLLIEDVTGMPYWQFIDENLFTPLDMEDSTFELPDPPEDVMARLASGYNYIDGAWKQYPFDYIKASPGIAMLTTADDMGRFLIAQLNEGRVQGEQVLPAGMIERMHETQFTNHPKLRGFTYGFAEWKENGLTALFHDGNAIGHSARLFMLPEANVAFFVAYNTVPFGPGGVPSEAGRLNRRLTTAFLDHFYPEPEQQWTPPDPMEGGAENLEQFAGLYRQTNYSRHTFQKIVSLLEQFSVAANGDGTLSVGSSKYVQIEPNLFQHAAGLPAYVAFRENGAGEIKHLFMGTGTFEKLPAMESAPVHFGLFIGFVLLFFTAVLSLLLRLMGKLRGKAWRFGLAEWAAFVASGLYLAFFVGLAMAMTQMDTMDLFAGVPPQLTMILSLPIVCAGLAVVAIIGIVVRWRRREGGIAWRLWNTAVVVGLVAFLPLLGYWNLIGY